MVISSGFLVNGTRKSEIAFENFINCLPLAQFLTGRSQYVLNPERVQILKRLPGRLFGIRSGLLLRCPRDYFYGNEGGEILARKWLEGRK